MPEQQPTPTPAPQPAPVPAPAPASQPASTPPAGDVASLPEWAQKVIRDTRTEAATYRTKHNDLQTEHQGSLDAIAQALGLKPNDDPATAAKTAAAERDTARNESKVLKVENAVMKTAVAHGIPPEALTDSRSFMAKLADLDPAAADFQTKLDAAIKAAADANPALGVGMPPASPRQGAQTRAVDAGTNAGINAAIRKAAGR